MITVLFRMCMVRIIVRESICVVLVDRHVGDQGTPINPLGANRRPSKVYAIYDPRVLRSYEWPTSYLRSTRRVTGHGNPVG